MYYPNEYSQHSFKCNMCVQLVELSAHLLACFLPVTTEFVQKVDFR